MSKQDATQYRDDQWCRLLGVHRENVVQYFCNSPFFDQASNNHTLLSQELPLERLRDMVGVEFVLDEENICEPELFVIRKQYRESPFSAKLLNIYYCLSGTIYQAPIVIDLFNSRVAKASLHLKRAFEALQEDIHPKEKAVPVDPEPDSLKEDPSSVTKKFRPRRELPPFTNVLIDLDGL